MEAHEVIATVAGSSVPVGGGILAWYVRYTIKKKLSDIDQLFTDLKGLSTKIDKVEKTLDTRISDIRLALKEELCTVEKDLVSVSERVKNLEVKK